jgi:hypothetical protein
MGLCGGETTKGYVERRAKGENTHSLQQSGDGLNICRTVFKYRSIVVSIRTASFNTKNSPIRPHSVFNMYFV